MKDLTYNDIIDRIGYFRNKANLSMRETSLRLGQNPQFMKTIESKQVELKVRTLLDFCKIVDISLFDFLCLENDYNISGKELLPLFNSLSSENKEIVIDLMRKLK